MDRLNAPGNSAPHTATEMNFGLRSAGNGRLARHGRPGQGSTYLRTALNAQSPLGRRHEAHPGISQFSQRLNLMDRLNAPGNSAPHTATEMNFGLRSAGNGRLARHGRPGQGSTYLRNYIPPGAFAMQRLYCPSFNLQCSTFQRSTFQRSMFNLPTFNLQPSNLQPSTSPSPSHCASALRRATARAGATPPLLTAIVIPPER